MFIKFSEVIFQSMLNFKLACGGIWQVNVQAQDALVLAALVWERKCDGKMSVACIVITVKKKKCTHFSPPPPLSLSFPWGKYICNK